MTGILLLTGCGSGKEDSVKSIKIGVTLYDQYDTFISELMQTFKSTTLKEGIGKGRGDQSGDPGCIRKSDDAE